MSLDAMKQALEALEDAVSAWRSEMEFRSCIDAAEPWAKAAEVLRAAIEQRKPVAWICEGSSSDEKRAIDYWQEDVDDIPIGTQLYTSPPAQRQWQGLTDEDREDILRWIEWKEIGSQPVAPQKLIAYVEKKLKERNA